MAYPPSSSQGLLGKSPRRIKRNIKIQTETLPEIVVACQTTYFGVISSLPIERLMPNLENGARCDSRQSKKEIQLTLYPLAHAGTGHVESRNRVWITTSVVRVSKSICLHCDLLIRSARHLAPYQKQSWCTRINRPAVGS
jgi:hypothetical protein